MKKIILTLLYFLPLLAFSTTTFEKNYGDNQTQDGLWTVQLTDGSFVTAGRTTDTSGYYEILIMKTDSTGDSLWSKTYGGYRNDFPATIKPTADGGFIVSATTYSFSSQPGLKSDWWILKLDSNGDTIWTTIVRNPENDRMYDVLETSDGSILGAGWTAQNNGYALGTLRKFSSNGQLISTFTLGSGANSYTSSIAELSNGHYMMIGSRFNQTFGADLTELDTSLNFVNNYFYNLPSTGEMAHALVPLPDGGYMLAAKSGFVINRFDIWMLRLNAQFDTLWTKMLIRPLVINDIEESFGFTKTGSSGYMLCGTQMVNTQLRALAYRLDTAGNILWNKDFGGSSTGDKFFHPLYLNDGGYLFTGAYIDSINFDADLYLVRTDSSGNFNSTVNLPDYKTTAISIYPNPSSGKLFFDLPDNNLYWEVEIYSQERLILRLAKIDLSKGLNLSGLNEGMYLIKLKNEKETVIRRIILNN